MIVLTINAQYQNPSRLDQVPYGSQINVTLENNSNNNISFLPLFKNHSGIPEDVLKNEQTLVQWLADTCVGINPDDYIMAMSHRLVKLLKGDAFINAAAYPQLYPQLWGGVVGGNAREQSFAKNYSMVGVLSGTYTMQCGEYSQVFASLLAKTGLVDTAHVRVITSGMHVFTEIFHDGTWKIVDFDPGTPGFTTTNHLSHQDLRFLGIQNFLDFEFSIHEYLSAIHGAKKTAFSESFFEPDSFIINHELTDYYNALTNMGVTFSPLWYETYDISGDIILPPGGKLKVEHVNKLLYLDTGHYQYSQLSHLAAEGFYAGRIGDTATINRILPEVIILVSEMTGLSSEEIEPLLSDDYFRIVNSFSPYYNRGETPYYTIVVPPGNYQIGVDVKAPGKVLSVQLNSGQMLLQDSYGNDTLIQALQPYEVAFWEADTGNIVPNKANHYLNEGWINSNDTVKIKVSWNPILYPFVHGELNIEYQSGDTLKHQYLINGVEFDPTLTVNNNIKSLSDNITLYPNPTTGNIFISQMSDIKIFSLLGEELVSKKQVSSVDMSDLSSGTYIVQLGNVRKKVIKN
jgi:hypothetical protein